MVRWVNKLPSAASYTHHQMIERIEVVIDYGFRLPFIAFHHYYLSLILSYLLRCSVWARENVKWDSIGNSYRLWWDDIVRSRKNIENSHRKIDTIFCWQFPVAEHDCVTTERWKCRKLYENAQRKSHGWNAIHDLVSLLCLPGIEADSFATM